MIHCISCRHLPCGAQASLPLDNKSTCVCRELSRGVAQCSRQEYRCTAIARPAPASPDCLALPPAFLLFLRDGKLARIARGLRTGTRILTGPKRYALMVHALPVSGDEVTLGRFSLCKVDSPDILTISMLFAAALLAVSNGRLKVLLLMRMAGAVKGAPGLLCRCERSSRLRVRM